MALFRAQAVEDVETAGFGPGVAPVAPRAQMATVVKTIAEVDATTREATGSSVVPDRWTWIASALLIVGGAVFGAWSHDHWPKGVTFTPSEGVSIFALFYILAQAIERLQEPFTPWIKGTKTEEGPAAGSGDTKSLNQRDVQALVERTAAEALKAPSDANARDAANAKRTQEQVRANMTLVLFASSACLAMAAAGVFKALMMKTVGVSGLAAWLDVVVTGLAIGGGTKPLHDLIANLQESKEEKKDTKTGARS